MGLFKWMKNRFLTGAVAVTIAITIALSGYMTMPESSYRDHPPPLNASQLLRQNELKQIVEKLSEEIGIRNQKRSLQETIEWLVKRLPDHQEYESDGMIYQNRSVEVRGQSRPDEIVVIGAHYDTVPSSPGADDNASGVAALLSLAKQFEHAKLAKTVRFIAFSQEEVGLLGSQAYANRSKALGEKIVAMLSFDMLAYYTDQPGSQAYPLPVGNLYPDRGNFLAFISNLKSRDLLRSSLKSFRQSATLASEGLALPEIVKDIGRSDHASFWRAGYPAILVTDTASFRNPHYHRESDRISTLDFDRFTRAVDGIAAVIQDLASDDRS